MRKAAIILWAFLLVMTAGCGSKSHVSAVSVSGNGDLQQAQAQAQVEPQLRAELAAELKRVLLLYPPRAVSAPPSSSASATVLSWDDEAGVFQWRYYSAGDYDQNGLVGVSDLTPLGVHFGKSSGGGPFDPSTVESVVDGDSNGLIGVSDVTPIGQNFGVKCQGYRLYFSTEETDVPDIPVEPNGAGTQMTAELALSEATGTPAERKQFSYAPDETPPEGYYWVRPYDGQELGTPSNVWLMGALNQAPIAVLRAAPTSGLVPLTVELLGIFSADLDGEIVKYEWDFDGPINGEVWLDTEDEGFVDHTYGEAGAYLATMRVTDDLDDTDTASELIVVHDPTPPSAELDYIQLSEVTPSHVQFDASPSVDDDGLIVRYEWDFDDDGEFEYDGSAEPTAEFYYWAPDTYQINVRVTDDDGLSDTADRAVVVIEGAAWQVNTVLEEISPPGGSPYSESTTALLEVDGRPAICFEMTEVTDEGYTAYIRALDADGSAWGEPIDLEMGSISNAGIGSAIIEGRPAVLSHSEFKRANDPQGSSWPPAVTIPSSENWYTELMLVNGIPASGNAKQFSIALDPLGDAWGEPSPVYGSGMSGFLSLAAVDGKPAMAMYRKLADYDDLVFISARDQAGRDWRVPVVLGGMGIASGTPRLAEVAGLPAIAYLDSALEALKFVRALDERGEHWGEPLVLDARVRRGMSMTLLDGRPAVVYLRTDDRQLMFMAANDEEGTSWGFPALVDGEGGIQGGFGNEGCSLTMVDGNPAVSYTLIRIELAEMPHELRYASYK